MPAAVPTPHSERVYPVFPDFAAYHRRGRLAPDQSGRGRKTRTCLDCFRGICEAATDGWDEPEGFDPRAFLRPRVRIRDHAGLPPTARAPDVGRPHAVPDSPPRSVLVVELHDLDHQRTGYGVRPRPSAAVGPDARQSPHGGGDTAGFRGARVIVCRVVRRDPGGKTLLPDFRGGGSRDGRTRAGRIHSHLVRGGWRAVGGRRPARWSGTRRALAGRARARLLRAARDLLGTWPAASPTRHLERRNGALRRALRPVHHPRARRVYRHNRRDHLRPRPRRGEDRSLRHGLFGVRGPLVAVLLVRVDYR